MNCRESTAKKPRGNSTSVISKSVLIVVGALTLSASSVQAQKVELYNDPRIESWSRDYLAGKREQVLLAVETDLKSGSPHPSSAMIWTQVQGSLGRLKETPVVADPVLRDALGSYPDIESLYLRGEYKQLLEKYPVAGASGAKDIWALNRLAFAASHQYRHEDALLYAKALLRLRPDNFRAVWTVLALFDDDEALYSQYLDLVKPDGEFGKTAAGRFLYPLISKRSYAALDRLFLVEQWLQEHRHDPRAVLFKADQLAALERYEEAAATYEQGMRGFPFPLNWIENQARQLIRLRRLGEAEEVIKKYAPLKYADART